MNNQAEVPLFSLFKHKYKSVGLSSSSVTRLLRHNRSLEQWEVNICHSTKYF